MKSIKQVLAAIMFTDSKEDTALMQEIEKKVVSNRERHRAFLIESTFYFEGIILQYYGNDMLSSFSVRLMDHSYKYDALD